jgi:hypothetical protein
MHKNATDWRMQHIKDAAVCITMQPNATKCIEMRLLKNVPKNVKKHPLTQPLTG